MGSKYLAELQTEEIEREHNIPNDKKLKYQLNLQKIVGWLDMYYSEDGEIPNLLTVIEDFVNYAKEHSTEFYIITNK